MKGRISNKMGEIQINPDVIALYAGTIAVECFGIVGMAAVSMKDGLVKLLKRESLTHGINVDIKENKISIDFHVIVSYGVSISAVSDNLIESVKYIQLINPFFLGRKAFCSCQKRIFYHSGINCTYTHRLLPPSQSL